MVAGEELLAEIHMHTTASDGSMTPEEAVRLARGKGLTAISVTDHDTFRGSSLAARISKVIGGPLIVPGAEIRTDHGDVLVYCERPYEEVPRSLHELRDWADENNCALVAAHPFHPGRAAVGWAITRLLHLFDAVEVWNSRGPPVFNLPAIVLAHRRGVPATSGSDAHVPQELGGSPVALPGEPTGAGELVEWIRKGLVRPTYGLLSPRAVPYILAWSIIRRLGLLGEED